MSSRIEKLLLKQVGRASADWSMIEPGDKVMACLSGGKDSYAMTWLLRLIQRKAPFDFDLVVVNLDQGHPGFPAHVLQDWLTEHGFAHRLLSQDTHSIVTAKIPEGKTFCSLCSRLRRGILYNAAVEMGVTKIALGHHRDDITETLLLNMLFAGQLKSMPPILRSDDGRNTVIRPLAYCQERDVAAYAEQMAFPIIPCDLCGSQEHLQRKRVKRLIAELAEENGAIPGNLFAAVQNVRPTHLMDPKLRAAMGVDIENCPSKADIEEALAAIG
ncbi:MAG: tRNA 2-thiocytidine(32) synthetase TtcA [Myxococcota bacterium]|nr:tRNA 2-thiocytidine(32) synthetase TtcA [Myxococcota bacterium]MEC8424221.1 tRNA 2-thiocytidine(32) synthetase TtcA [Myxococcota bacterium]